MFERYTERARRVIFFARYEASQLGSNSIETEHLLLGLIREGKGLTSRIFSKSHLSMESIRKEIEGRALYRDMPRPLWPWLAGGGGLATFLLAAWLLRRMRAPGRLVFVDGPRAGEVVRLRAGRLRIGSRDDNDLVIDLPTVSRNHAELTARGRKIEIEDLHSRNGTHVNGAPVRRSPLHPGDRIGIADVSLRYER